MARLLPLEPQLVNSGTNNHTSEENQEQAYNSRRIRQLDPPDLDAGRVVGHVSNRGFAESFVSSLPYVRG